jgi:hypothetical protein
VQGSEEPKNSDSTGGTPAQETWYPARRRLWVTLFTVTSLLMVVAVIVALTFGDRDTPAYFIILLAQAVVMALQAWTHSRIRLRADAGGLHWVAPLRTTTYRWEDIAEIRPSILKGKQTYLVLVLRNRQVIDLPVTEEYLASLRRWHAAAPGR